MADAAALAALASPSSILRVALPAILTSVAPPACVAVQLALLARVGSTSAATFAGCVSAANLISASCNFLVNGVASQVGADCTASWMPGPATWVVCPLSSTVTRSRSAAFTGAEAGTLYTVILSDPDAPSVEDPKFGEWQHWIAVNAPGDDVGAGEAMA